MCGKKDQKGGKVSKFSILVSILMFPFGLAIWSFFIGKFLQWNSTMQRVAKMCIWFACQGCCKFWLLALVVILPSVTGYFLRYEPEAFKPMITFGKRSQRAFKQQYVRKIRFKEHV